MSDPTCEPATFYGPCSPYATLDDVRSGPCPVVGLALEDTEPGDPEADPPVPPTLSPDGLLVTEALTWASRRTFLATGQRFFGCCTATIRPCRSFCGGIAGATLPADFPWVSWQPEALPAWLSGLVPVWGCGCPTGEDCACTNWDRIPLPLLPARQVVNVTVEAVVLDPDAYTLRNGAWLVRLDGLVWPSCQEDAPLGSPNTWSVTYTHGLDLPPEAKPLVIAYALELAKACKGQECGLAQGVQVLHRDGADFGVVLPASYREKGLTGFGPLDDWISLMLGGHVAEPPRIYRPGRSMTAPILEPAP